LRALTDLEASLGEAAAERPINWVVPGNLGPIPSDLHERALALVAGQREMISELRLRQRTTAAHLTALRAVPATGSAGASVYLDTSG
jgi:hypothetical protein